MNPVIINVLLAVLPTFFIVYFFFKKDNRKPEPAGKIVKLFIIGFISVIPALLIEVLFEEILKANGGVSGNAFAGAFIRGFVVAALVEESIKYFVVKKFAYRMREFDEITDGIVYTVTASLGFACFENLFYSIDVEATSILLLRGITAVPLHAIASGIMGYYIGRSKFSRRSFFLRGLFFAVFIHGSYDFLIFTGTYFAFLIIPLLVISGAVLLDLLSDAKARDRKRGLS